MGKLAEGGLQTLALRPAADISSAAHHVSPHIGRLTGSDIPHQYPTYRATALRSA